MLSEKPHRRYNILTGEWILVSPHRTKRPWQGKKENLPDVNLPSYDPDCYLCPTNTRAGGQLNEDYSSTFSFVNDFGALLYENETENFEQGLLKAETEKGICKVICFSPDHSLTLPLMDVSAIVGVVQLWKKEYKELGDIQDINHVQIFENKGQIMGCSNPHPHGQIWAQSTIPGECLKKGMQQKEYHRKNNRSLLDNYLEQELENKERIVYANDYFVALVPFWATWPYEVMIVPKKQYAHIGQLDSKEEVAFAEAIKNVTTKYDNLFKTSFPYSSGIHQAPTDGLEHPEWHFHMSFYPPLLRSATVKKFMVGYEMFANPQRDITAEMAAVRLRELSSVHYSKVD
ncbi:UDP-glucose--hexose-1-phosphate uridylyltransferase [Croceitalea sp. MTPC9]|uniref:UDP-glucose--hexose-1-phosphate uridylyltransferase n=1 Tax=unclassified Croceitalea TaxID=2632280 RepID=UPI002B3F9D2A|nr:UDP-glucose--hexose-1-phosphate uridylyltransferase [Croceitalea sp. MTPC6]GMN17349.1 UDP-glucose--hexose-1-phosphate uridylyltransferase [Croceitalea sp. MTPC9]